MNGRGRQIDIKMKAQMKCKQWGWCENRNKQKLLTNKSMFISTRPPFRRNNIRLIFKFEAIKYTRIPHCYTQSLHVWAFCLPERNGNAKALPVIESSFFPTNCICGLNFKLNLVQLMIFFFFCFRNLFVRLK